MPSLNSNDEQKLVEGVRQAVRYVDDDNMSPNDALVKVSRDLSLLPGQARAAVNAFNNGRQVAQWKANTPVLDKLAEFELADYDVIHDTVWGGNEKKANDHYLLPDTAIHEDYASEPKWVDMRDKQKLAALDIPLRTDIVKEASDRVDEHEFRHDSNRRASSAWSTFSMSRRTYEDQRSKHAAAKDKLGIRLNILSNYFKKFAQDRLPFDVVDKTVATYYGSQGRALMNVVAEQFPKEKRAADSKRYWEAPIEMSAEPFTFVRNAVEAAKELNLTKAALDMSEAAFNNAEEALRPFSQAPSQSSQETTEFSPFLIDGKKGDDRGYSMPQMDSPDGPSVGRDVPFDPKVFELLKQIDARSRANTPISPEQVAQLRAAYGWDHDPNELDAVEGLMEMEEASAKQAYDKQPAGQLPRHDCHGVHPDQTHEEWVREEFDNPPTRDWEREKDAAGLITGALIGGGAKPIMESLIGGKGTDKEVEKIESLLGSPEHENELRKIRAQVMLSEMMTDSDNPISGHDPEEVLAAYNDIAQFAPRISEQPAAIQPMLAKRLAGNVEPFEVKEMGDIEKTLTDTDVQSNVTKSNE